MNPSTIEKFFLDNFNADKAFRFIDRSDYLFLYYIRKCLPDSPLPGGVYLSDLGAAMNRPMPELSKAIRRLQEKGYVVWKTDEAKERTFVSLTDKAEESMRAQRETMTKLYESIRAAVPPDDLETTLCSLRKINEILQDQG